MSTERKGPRRTTGFLYDDVYLKHDTGPGHPEQPARLTAIVNHLNKNGLADQLVMLGPPRAIDLRQLKAVHTADYIERAQAGFADGMRFLDSIDVPISEQSYEVALQAAGGALDAVDAVMQGRVTNAFCAVRPPGHHALPDRAMGFCLFNNVALATRYAQSKYKMDKVLIVDWDVHHGNGTQAIFYEDPTVFYFSTHQYPFYPGTGAEYENGAGAGVNTTLNVPLSPGADDADYLAAFETKLKPAALAFKPDMVFISAGFDAHESDPLGSMKVTSEGFSALTRFVVDIASQCCGDRIVSLLEGGYDVQGLASAVGAHIRELRTKD